MRRREFVGLVRGAVAWPVAARGQPTERVRRIGVLVGLDPFRRKLKTRPVGSAVAAKKKGRLRAALHSTIQPD
jgi:hypothetical protein